MVETERASAREKDDRIGFGLTDVDIERICEKFRRKTNPPEVFLVTSKAIRGALLGVSMAFLERGQLLPCPGLPLVGAAFDPDWGFARAEVALRDDGSVDFRLPSGRFDPLGDGDTYGYRLCPIDNDQIPEAISQLAKIRAGLARPRQRPRKKPSIKVTVTQI